MSRSTATPTRSAGPPTRSCSITAGTSRSAGTFTSPITNRARPRPPAVAVAALREVPRPVLLPIRHARRSVPGGRRARPDRLEPLCCPTTTRAQPTRPASGTGGRATSARVCSGRRGRTPAGGCARLVGSTGYRRRAAGSSSYRHCRPARATRTASRGCHERRSLRLVAAQHAITVQSWCIEPLSITTCGGEVRVRELIRRIEREGWVVRLRNGGHLELSHPRADRAVITSATPRTGGGCAICALRCGGHYRRSPRQSGQSGTPARSDLCSSDRLSSTRAAGAGGRCRGTPGKAETIATPSGRPSRLL